MLKFLADIGISTKAVAFLKTQGYDALHLIEEQLERLSDEQIIRKAKVEDRVVLTHDLDFGDLMAASGDALPSIIHLPSHQFYPSTNFTETRCDRPQHSIA